MNIIFNIQGGLGKSIMATAVCKAIKANYPESFLIVITGYKDVFLNNPHVNKTLTHTEQHEIYKNYIDGFSTKFFVADPYYCSEFINNETHLIKIWCDLFKLKYNNETPEFFLSEAEKQFYASIYKFDKPILAFQSNGGGANQGFYYNWARDLPEPLILDLIQKLKKDYVLIHIKRPDQKSYPDTMQALDGFRSIAYLISIAKKCLFIDSFAQHLAFALNKKAIVCWIATEPSVFGYDFHTNIQSQSFTRKPTYQHANYSPFSLVEPIETLPYNDLNEIFNANNLYKLLKA